MIELLTKLAQLVKGFLPKIRKGKKFSPIK